MAEWQPKVCEQPAGPVNRGQPGKFELFRASEHALTDRILMATIDLERATHIARLTSLERARSGLSCNRARRSKDLRLLTWELRINVNRKRVAFYERCARPAHCS